MQKGVQLAELTRTDSTWPIRSDAAVDASSATSPVAFAAEVSEQEVT